jgi:hypothetical protein
LPPLVFGFVMPPARRSSGLGCPYATGVSFPSFAPAFSWPLAATEKNRTCPGAGNFSVMGEPRGLPVGKPGGGAALAEEPPKMTDTATALVRIARLIS